MQRLVRIVWWPWMHTQSKIQITKHNNNKKKPRTKWNKIANSGTYYVMNYTSDQSSEIKPIRPNILSLHNQSSDFSLTAMDLLDDGLFKFAIYHIGKIRRKNPPKRKRSADIYVFFFRGNAVNVTTAGGFSPYCAFLQWHDVVPPRKTVLAFLIFTILKSISTRREKMYHEPSTNETFPSIKTYNLIRQKSSEKDTTITREQANPTHIQRIDPFPGYWPIDFGSAFQHQIGSAVYY